MLWLAVERRCVARMTRRETAETPVVPESSLGLARAA
jgi:hypothetical protein